MLLALSVSRSMKHVGFSAPPRLPRMLPKPRRSSAPLWRYSNTVTNRSFHVTSRIGEIPFKPTSGIFSDDDPRKGLTGGEKPEPKPAPTRMNPREELEESEDEIDRINKAKLDVAKETEGLGESHTPGKLGKEEDNEEKITSVPSVIASQTALISRRSRKARAGSRLARPISSKGFAYFTEVGQYSSDEVEAMQHLKDHSVELITSLCTDPRSFNLSNYPAVSATEQLQVEKSIETLIDRQLEKKLDIEAFAHLTSTPMSSLMAKGRTAMFNQIGFTLKAPSDHEGYVLHTIQRLAQKHGSKVIDFDLGLLRMSENWYTDALLQSGSTEEGTSNLMQLFQEILRDDDDFALFSEALFEVIQKQSTNASASSASSTSSTTSEAANTTAPKIISADATSSGKSAPSFVVILRGIERLRAFPYRMFKELLRTCRAHVLFLELELSSTPQASASAPIGIIGSASPSFMLAPNAIVADEEDEGGPAFGNSLRSVLERLATSHPAKHASVTHHFLHDDPLIMTNKSILEAERRKAEEAKSAGPPGLASILARLGADGPANTPPAKATVHQTTMASVISAAEAASAALATIQRRSVLYENLKQLAACIRASHVVLIPNHASSKYSSSSSSVSTTAPSLANDDQPAIVASYQSPAAVSSQTVQHESIPVWEPSMNCLTNSWLDPGKRRPSDAASFELTCLLLATQIQLIPSIHRIVREAIKLQDMHQFKSSGTWNHFSPLAGRLVRVGAVEAALHAAALDGVSNMTDDQILNAMEEENKTNAVIRMPLEIRFLHEALNLELGITDKVKSSKKALLDTELPNSDEILLPLARKAYAQIAHAFNAPRVLSKTAVGEDEAELDKRRTFEEQKRREARDEEILQERLMGLKLTPMEKNVLSNYVAPSRLETSFDDIGSLEHAKEELLSLIVPMSLPVFHKENSLINTPLGILLYGPPGTGKTMLAKALAKTAGASFIHISASTIISKWLGDSEGHAAAVFSLARKISPCLIFIDEVDGLLHSRDTSEHETSRRVKNEFFSGWDGLLSTSSDPNMSVTVIAATNRPFDLDNAALRRLPHRVLVNLPDHRARAEILKKTLKDVFIAPTSLKDATRSQVTEEQRNQVIEELASLTEGYSGSDIKSVCTRAAQQHVRDFMASVDLANLVKQRTSTQEDPSVQKGQDLGAEEEDDEEILGNSVAASPYEEQARLFAKRPITMNEFSLALSEITASVNQRSGSSMELKKWHETYGSKPKGHRAGIRITNIGF